MSYATDGFEIARQVLDPDTIAGLKAAADGLAERFRRGDRALMQAAVTLADLTTSKPDRNPGVLPETVMQEPFIIGNLLAHDRRFVALLQSPAPWDLAATAIGTGRDRLVFHFSNLTLKPPHVGPAIAWHRDVTNTYFLPADGNLVRLLVPLDAMSEENGGTGILPGSHMLDDEAATVRCKSLDPQECTWPALEAGDVLITHPRVIHGGPPNRSDKPRALLVLQFGLQGADLLHVTQEFASLKTLEELQRI